MTVAHIVCGPTGAGKTTYANALAERLGAAVFSIDDWMVTLFGPDIHSALDWVWINERADRCRRQILRTAVALSRAGQPTVLDIGLLRATDRQAAADSLQERGVAVRLHALDVDRETRWRRVEARNAEQGETFRLTVTRAMFDGVELVWQPPTEAELARFGGERVAAERAAA